MELKYYLRGLGLGIVITAIIMGIVSSRSEAMTDEEIIARAKQLGMIEDRVLSEAASDDEISEDDSSADESAARDSTKEDGSAQTDNTLDENTVPDENVLPDENDSSGESDGMTEANDTAVTTLPDDEETGQEEPQAEQNVSDMQEASDTPMVVTVGSGDGSYTVSKKLEDVGAVASASAFDTFLCENGYDKKIRAGSYTIPAGAGEDQIARMITGLE